MIKQCAVALLACFAVGTGIAQTPASTTDTAMKPADNSKANSAEVNSTMTPSTADGQSNAASDIKITQQIRKSVIADKHLSTYAHNVKIVAVNGAVTLNGVVRSGQERSAIQMKAQAVVGKEKVTNDITIAPKN